MHSENMDTENEIIIVGHDSDYEDEFQGMITEELNGEENDNEAYNSNQWPVAATKLLISFRGAMSTDFEKIKKKGQKAVLWQTIANKINKKNYNLTAKHCDEKWRRLLTRFRQVNDASKRSRNGGVRWQYYDLMQESMSSVSKQTISPPKNLLHESSKSESTPSVSKSHNLSTPELSSPASSSSPSPTHRPSLLKINNSDKMPVWFEKFKILKEQQIEANNDNTAQLRERLDKLEKREENMLEIQKQLVSKLDTANKIELQKLEMFKKMFNNS
ncbi:trihelix transcription factor GT-3b-like [Sipha flava]|uniref:Trihelix transcription factor GT-3b-like n=1 Tax=Sipha flava TaxID=143950 RepID=A0A8B8F8Z2_9HEMI|nr:trihelix transcription factor GT-3b-like [Sipha flava]